MHYVWRRNTLLAVRVFRQVTRLPIVSVNGQRVGNGFWIFDGKHSVYCRDRSFTPAVCVYPSNVYYGNIQRKISAKRACTLQQLREMSIDRRPSRCEIGGPFYFGGAREVVRRLNLVV